MPSSLQENLLLLTCLCRESSGHLTGTSKSSLTLAASFSASSTIRLLPRFLQPISQTSPLLSAHGFCLPASSLSHWFSHSHNHCLTLLVCPSAGPYHVFALPGLLTTSWAELPGTAHMDPHPAPLSPTLRAPSEGMFFSVQAHPA